MIENSLALAGQSSRFNSPAIDQTVVRVPPSPMVLQSLMQNLANLNAKVDALATRQPHVIEVRPAEVSPMDAQQVEVKPPVRVPEQKVDRKKTRSIFD